MKTPVAQLKSIIRGFSHILKVEQDAIGKRSFDKLDEISTHKAAFVADFDSITATLGNSEAPDALVVELNIVRAMAEENAAALKALAEGVQQARSRLKALSETDLKTGVYSPDGAAIKNPDATTITTKI